MVFPSHDHPEGLPVAVVRYWLSEYDTSSVQSLLESSFLKPGRLHNIVAHARFQHGRRIVQDLSYVPTEDDADDGAFEYMAGWISIMLKCGVPKSGLRRFLRTKMDLPLFRQNHFRFDIQIDYHDPSRALAADLELLYTCACCKLDGLVAERKGHPLRLCDGCGVWKYCSDQCKDEDDPRHKYVCNFWQEFRQAHFDAFSPSNSQFTTINQPSNSSREHSRNLPTG